MTQKKYFAQMWPIALPAIITNISTPLLGLVDIFIMGHLPDSRYLAAIAFGAMMIGLLYSSVNFLRMATTGLTAQAAGDKDKINISQIFLRAALLAMGIGLLFMSLRHPIAEIFFSLTSADYDVENFAREYFDIRIWGAPFALINYVTMGWLIGLHRAKDALLISLIMNISNIILSFLFVYGFKMDISGVALGTILSEAIACIFGLYRVSQQNLVLYGYRIWHIKARADLFNFAQFKALYTLNRDIFIRTLCLTGSLAAFTILGANISKEILAANALLINLQMVTSYGLDGFAQAAEVLVGKEIGKKSPSGFKKAVLLSGKWALITAGLFSLTYLIFGEIFIHALTDISAIRNIAKQYLIWVIILPLISVWCYQLDGIFIGATAGKYMRNGMVISTVLYALSLMIFLPLWQNHGLWLSYCIFLIARALTLALEYPKIIPNPLISRR